MKSLEVTPDQAGLIGSKIIQEFGWKGVDRCVYINGEYRYPEDFADIIENVDLDAGPDYKAAIQAFCEARVFAIVDRNAQVNLLRAHGRGAFDDAQEALYDGINDWTDATIEKCRELIAENNSNYEDESLWPPISDELIAFAKKF